MGKKSSAREIKKERRIQAALKLRASGNSYRDIGVYLGVSRQTAWNDVQEGLERIVEESAIEAEKLRALETMRLEKALSRVCAHVEDNDDYDDQAIRTMIRLSESLRKLHGLDAPQRTEQKISMAPEEAAARVRAIFGLPPVNETEPSE